MNLTGEHQHPVPLAKFHLPPLFVTAYVQLPLDQEDRISKYPLALVSQENHTDYPAWKSRIKSHNPTQRMLGYQQIAHAVSAQGPGNEIVRSAGDVWIRHPDGTIPHVVGKPLIDYRNSTWQNAIVEATEAVLRDFDYSGIFFDNCTVFSAHHPDAGVREELAQALDKVLTSIRAEYPYKITEQRGVTSVISDNMVFIGNGKQTYSALNGIMVEGRLNDLSFELRDRHRLTSPRYNLYQHRLVGGHMTDEELRDVMQKAFYAGSQ